MIQCYVGDSEMRGPWRMLGKETTCCELYFMKLFQASSYENRLIGAKAKA